MSQCKSFNIAVFAILASLTGCASQTNLRAQSEPHQIEVKSSFDPFTSSLGASVRQGVELQELAKNYNLSISPDGSTTPQNGRSAFEREVQSRIDNGTIHGVLNLIVTYPDGSYHEFKMK